MSLSTRRLTLRQWRDADRAAFARMNTDPEVMEHFPAASTAAESEALVDRSKAHLDEHGWGLWAVEITATQQFIGFVGLTPDRLSPWDDQVEIGWRLRRSAWGRGYATEAGHEALRYAFQVVGLEEVVSFTTEGNIRSVRSCIGSVCGMTRDGTSTTRVSLLGIRSVATFCTPSTGRPTTPTLRQGLRIADLLPPREGDEAAELVGATRDSVPRPHRLGHRR